MVQRQAGVAGTLPIAAAVLASSLFVVGDSFVAVPGEFYFMAVGGLGVTLAGFAGLIAALDRRGAGFSPVATWRIRRVVYSGFGVTFVGFATVALYTITEDVSLTVRLATIGLVLSMWVDWRAWLPGAAWPDERRRRGAVIGRFVASAAALVNVALASVGYLQLLLLLLLSAPISIFMLAVADVTRGGVAPDNDAREVPDVTEGERSEP